MSKKEDIGELVQDLRRQIRYHDHLYYVRGEPEISDIEYDKLYSRLKELEYQNPEFDDPTSPTRRVGGDPLEGFEPFKHMVPMLSLENTYSIEEVEEWEKRINKKISSNKGYIVEEKIDGVGISLTYKNGKLAVAASRGNGVQGDNVTQNIRTQRSIPLVLNTTHPPSLVEIRGEMFIKKFLV